MLKTLRLPVTTITCSVLSHLSTLRIKRLRGRITGSFYLRKRLIEKCGNNQELQYKHRRQMSTLKSEHSRMRKCGAAITGSQHESN